MQFYNATQLSNYGIYIWRALLTIDAVSTRRNILSLYKRDIFVREQQ